MVAAIHGVCVGGGTNMVTFADIRYCSNDAWFQVKEAALGLAADVGALQRLNFLLSVNYFFDGFPIVEESIVCFYFFYKINYFH